MEPTEKQRRAIEFDGSLAVVAGAGTGKTAMLSRRYVHHVVSDGMSPLEVAAVTFTEKAAAELRSRIRTELAERAGEAAAAEADAAQISTIHALAARICRDFPDLAGIPPDFRMLDETDAAILESGWFDEAMNEVDGDVVKELGYTWLRTALRELLRDPSGAGSALTFGETEWREAIDNECEAALNALVHGDSWKRAVEVLSEHRGDAADPVEKRRLAALAAFEDIRARRNVNDALLVLKGLASSHGTAARWPAGGLETVRACLLELRDAFKSCRETTTLEFGSADAEVCRRLVLLRRAFDTARSYMQRAKLEKRVMDFADLEHYAINVLGRANARAHYARRWKAILVDEFQDTNPDQERLLGLLIEGGARLTIVGDGKQSVYGFRRADPRVFERVSRRIGSEIVLDRTFRTHAKLLECENTVFAELLGEMHQPLTSDRSDHPHEGPFLTVHAAGGDGVDIDELRRREASFIAGEIGRMIDDGLDVWDKDARRLRPLRPSDIAVLSRTREPLDVYIDALLEAGIPAVNTGGGSLLETRVAMDMSAVLRFAADTSDDVALVAVLRGPFFAVSDRELQRAAAIRQKDETWWQLIGRAGGELSAAHSLLADVIAEAQGLSAERLLEIVDERTGYTAVIENLSQGGRRRADRTGFMALLRKFAQLGRSDVTGVDRYLRKLYQAGTVVARPPVDAGNAVSLMTIHAAKGLEWPVVFVPNLCARRRSDSSQLAVDTDVGVAFKVTMRDDDGRTIKAEPAIYNLIRKRNERRQNQESARVMYVALTRARDRLVLTSAGESGADLELLRPGLEMAGIPIEPMPPVLDRPPARELPAEHISPFERVVQLRAVAGEVRRIAMSSLDDYAECPKRFRLRHIDGHPGLTEGGVQARKIGSLAHLALELDIDTPDGLGPFAEGASEAVKREAAELAAAFGKSRAFSEFRVENIVREEAAEVVIEGVTLTGKADLVGADWVLDFKTDSEIEPERHVLQLAAYAEALSKPRAVVAYLRYEQLFEYASGQLAKAGADLRDVVTGIKRGCFDAAPSARACRRCDFSIVCHECHDGTANG